MTSASTPSIRSNSVWVIVLVLLTGCNQTANIDRECNRLDLLVGFGVGGGSDTFARKIADPLAQVSGLPVQVFNVTAGGGIAAYRELIARPPDGCSLLVVSSDYEILALYEPETVRLEQLRFLVRAHTEAGLLIAVAGRGESWPELLARVRVEGRPLLIGGVGARSFDRAAVAIALSDIDTRYRYIPYSGAREMQADLLGGRLDLFYEEYGSIVGLLEAGRVEALVNLTDERLAALADTPSLRDLDLRSVPPIWRGIAIGSDVAPLRAMEISRWVIESLQSPQYRSYEKSRYLDINGGTLTDSKKFSASISSELESFRLALLAE